MDFAKWDTCFNLLLLIFWIRLWARDEREMAFNPYLSATNRLASGALHFLRPAFLMMPERIVAVIAMALLLALRAVAAPRTADGWILQMGFEVRQAFEGQLMPFIAFTAISFAVFLFKLWSVSLIFLRGDAAATSDHAHAALAAACRPFIDIPYALRPAVLLVYGLLIAVALDVVGYPSMRGIIKPSDLPEASAVALGLSPVWPALISTVAAWVAVLQTLVSALVALVIMSLLAMLLNVPSMAIASRDWIDMLLGPMRRYPLRIGMFDLTPLLYMIILSTIHGGLQMFLLHQYMRLYS